MLSDLNYLHKQKTTAVTQANIKRVVQSILENHQITRGEIANKLDVSAPRMETIIHSHLEYNEVSTSRVQSSFDQKAICMDIVNRAATTLSEGRDDLLKKILCDETWGPSFQIGMKASSGDIVAPGSRNDFEVQPSAGKLMSTVFWDLIGLISVDFFVETWNLGKSLTHRTVQ